MTEIGANDIENGSSAVFRAFRGYGNILDCIGNTPIVPIKRLNPNKRIQLLAKLGYNRDVYAFILS